MDGFNAIACFYAFCGQTSSKQAIKQNARYLEIKLKFNKAKIQNERSVSRGFIIRSRPVTRNENERRVTTKIVLNEWTIKTKSNKI